MFFLKEIDPYSYHCGVIDAFNEVVRAEVKKLALSHPFHTKEERDKLIPFTEKICEQYETCYYIEDEPLLTDLFPLSLNKGKFSLLFFKDQTDITYYLQIKQDKHSMVQKGLYHGAARQEIAFRFGSLLSYSKAACEKLIAKNNEKE